MTRKTGYVWHLRRLMAEHGMFATLAALCDILGCGPGDLIEPVAPGGPGSLPGRDLGARPAGLVRPRRARILPGPGTDA